MSSFLRRFKRKEESSIVGRIPPPHTLESNSNPNEKSGTIGDGAGNSTAREVGEAEANQKLAAFEKAHRWDPNLGNDTLDEIDDAVNTRDPNVEGKLYDEVFENSPYPEVSAPNRISKQI